jgi:hypothetical protein
MKMPDEHSSRMRAATILLIGRPAFGSSIATAYRTLKVSRHS